MSKHLTVGRYRRTLCIRVTIRGHVFGLNLFPFMVRHWTPEDVFYSA